MTYLKSLSNLRGVRIDDYASDTIPVEVMDTLHGFPYVNMLSGGSPVNVALQALHLSKGWDLVESTLGHSGHEYDLILRTRPDVCFHPNMRIIDLDTVMPDRVSALPGELFIPPVNCPLESVTPSASPLSDRIFIHPLVMPTFDHWGGWNDQIAFGPPQTMKWYLKYIEKVDEVCGTEGVRFDGENTLKLSILAHARAATRRTGHQHAVRLLKLPGFYHGLCRVSDTTCRESCPPWNTHCLTLNYGN